MATPYPSPMLYGQASSMENVARVTKTEFGDGYQSVTADGINNLVRSGTLVHPLLPKTDSTKTAGADTLRAFLKANMTGQVVTILNMMEDPSGSTTMNVYIESYTENQLGLNSTFTVKFREAFST